MTIEDYEAQGKVILTQAIYDLRDLALKVKAKPGQSIPEAVAELIDVTLKLVSAFQDSMSKAKVKTDKEMNEFYNNQSDAQN